MTDRNYSLEQIACSGSMCGFAVGLSFAYRVYCFNPSEGFTFMLLAIIVTSLVAVTIPGIILYGDENE